ncbi:MAG TPA: restriction endonuclease subunit S [Pseudomonas sabulinigri]|uniref:Type I restriction modification DNA specificity domain-containing protein n=1 Tax=marine sediment metagenome TaxID=412755 RepID=A0A0F9YT98_9ZZZZ|nr:restriction endonuclease subunit S [Halopseudomonas sabulinigri]HEC51972.1 restriction endonuclease subunit S [Halopseudomonas sabulinigri]
MSYFARSDELPAWVAALPDSWGSDWIKWGVRLSTVRPSEEEQARLPYISNEDIASWTGKLLNDDPKPTESEGRKFQIDDVLLNKLRPYLAKVYHADFDGVSSGELLCLRPSNTVMPRYLFYVLASKGFIDSIDAETFGSKMPRADWEIVGHQPLPLPPIETQRRIVQFLDEKTTRIDGLIEKKRALLERLKEKRQAMITRAVTKGLNPEVPMKPSGIDWLGDVPAHWEVLPLRRLARKVATGRTPPSSNVDYFTEGELNWFTPGDFENNIELHESGRRITPEAINDGVATLFPVGTIFLVGIGATLGKVAVNTAAGSANQQLNAILLESDNSPYFAAYFLHGFREAVRVTSNGNTLGILNQDGTKSIPMTRPPLSEQKDIVNHLTEHDRQGEIISQAVERSVDSLEGYRAALITAAVTGQIGGLQ